MRGRKPKPTRLKLIEGNPGRRPINGQEPKPPGSLGVRAKPWGRSQRFPGAFIFAGHPKSGQPVADGHAFIRTSSSSLPIRKLWGPSVPREMERDAVTQEFQDAALELPGRILHEVRSITNGVVGAPGQG